MYYVPEGTKECGFYECKKCGNRFLSLQTMQRIPCPDCAMDIDYEIGPDESMEDMTDTAELIDKIAELGGTHKADILKSNMVCFNTRKHSNESIYYNVGFLEDAIQQQKKVIFYYYDLNENGEKVYRREHHHYVVEPIALVFNEDNYYLMVYSARHDGTANYRVDRMDHVEIIDEDISEKALAMRDGLDCYTEQVFKMYGGQPVDVVLEFDAKLIGVVYDKFGEDTKMIRSGENCIATVKVQISPVFWGWLFQFAGQMKVLSPDSVIADYKKHAAMLDE
mgnify:CR=1 FL=1